MRYRRISAAALALGIWLLAGAAQADSLTDIAAPFRAALESQSYGLALGLIFLAGLATSLTPCVYPMIVITVSIFGARQAESKVEAAKLSTAFVAGLAALFTPLGVIAALSGDIFGSQLANPVVLITIAVIFLVLAVSSFGAFELDLPASLKNRLSSAGGVGLRGAFVLGLVSAVIAAPCTGPVVGFLLTWIGTTGDAVFGAASFFAYSLGLGTLFWLVGTFSMSIPKSGKWVEYIKSVFGIVMVVAALYFVRDLIPGLRAFAEHTPMFLAGSAALALVGVILGAIHLSYHDPDTLGRVRKTGGVLLAVVGLSGMVGYAEALPPGAQIAWLEDYGAARELARAQGKPLLVDFGASWCGACGELDRETFADKRVVFEGQRFVPVRIDLSPGEHLEEREALLAKYNHRGLPLVVLHDAQGNEAARVTSFMAADEFLQLMRSVQ